MENVLNTIYEYLATYGLQVAAALLIFIIGRWLAKLVSMLVGKALTKAKMDGTIVSFVQSLCYVALLVFVVIAALSRLGVQTTSFIAVIGAAGLAVGLALQGSLANFASGVLMVIFKPFRVGDFVQIAGATGTVQAIHIFNTVLDSPENTRIIIPNAQVTGGNILNYTVNGTRRVDLLVGISYGDDIKKAKQVIEKVLSEDKRVLKEPAPTVAVTNLSDSSVDFVVRPWVKPSDYWGVYFDTIENVKIALEQNGITIPFPQRDVHMYSEDSNTK